MEVLIIRLSMIKGVQIKEKELRMKLKAMKGQPMKGIIEIIRDLMENDDVDESLFQIKSPLQSPHLFS